MINCKQQMVDFCERFNTFESDTNVRLLDECVRKMKSYF